MAKNYTDPKVIFDPSVKFNPIARKYYGVSYNYEKTEDDMYSNVNNQYNTLKIDAVEYPLIVINSRNIEQTDILYMGLKFTSFLPEIELTILDELETEQKIETSNMSGSIEVVICSRVDSVYKNIRLHFRIYNVNINQMNPKETTYFGTYDIEAFRQVNTGFLKKNQTKANFYELLYVIAQKCGLGFAATKSTEDINDRALRNIFTQRYPDYIKEQLKFAGCDEDSVFDAWVDPNNYIVLVNVSWVLNEKVSPHDLTIVVSKGFPSTDRDVPDPVPEEMERCLTNFNKISTDSNLFIKGYSMVIDNEAVWKGTSERIYTINWDDSNVTTLNSLDIQTKQNSVDGEYLKDYNTDFNRPIPVFNFNDDDYDLNTQKIVRRHFWNKHRHQILKVKLKHINIGLQRGTLVGINIWEQNAQVKEIMMSNEQNLVGDQGTDRPKLEFRYDEENITDDEIILSEGMQLLSGKLSDLYYIDSIVYEYSKLVGEIEQTLYLIKKGATSGYNNAHTHTRIEPKD